MAQNKWFYLDEAGLSQYDALIKQYIDTADQKAIKYITFVPATDPKVGTNPTTIYFWKSTPTQTPDIDADYKVVLPDSTNFLQKATGASITAGQWAVFDANGNITGVTATAANTAFDDTTAHTGGTTVQAAIDSIAQATGGGVAAKTVYITETAGGSSDPYSKRYGIYQGGSGSSAAPVPAEKLADIDIPKDMVVEEGSVVDIVFDDTDDTLHEGSISGPDVTEAIKGQGGTATAADAGKYIKLVIANASSTALYIKATDLVDIYTGGTSADGTISISASNEITFTLSAAHLTSLGKADTALQPVTTATADNIVTFDSTGHIQDSGVAISDVTQGLEDVIAPAFDSSVTYNPGDYVMYESKLYEYTAATASSGAWDSTKWTESKVMTSFQPIDGAYISGLFS